MSKKRSKLTSVERDAEIRAILRDFIREYVAGLYLDMPGDPGDPPLRIPLRVKQP